MPAAGIVVVGAGVIGCSVAWHLASRGARDILVVDRAPHPGSGSTGKATGGFRTQFGTSINVALSVMSLEALLRFEEDTGVDPGYDPRGYLFLATDKDQLRELDEARTIQPSTQLLSRRDALELNPAIDDDTIIGGTFSSLDGFVKPLEILRGYFEAARRLGVRFEFGREIRELDPHVTYVNACGAWAAGICEVAVTPVRRRIAATVPTTALPSAMPMTIWAGDGFHLRVRDGRVLLLWPDTPPDDDRWLDEVLSRAHLRLPCLKEIPIEEEWSGFYEMSPDRHAIIGRCDNIYLANGSSGHGVMHAPAIGRLVSELIIDGRTSIDIEPLRPSRFAEGDAISGSSLL
jgi:sarcosine oxidase, subunit beta